MVRVETVKLSLVGTIAVASCIFGSFPGVDKICKKFTFVNHYEYK